MHVILTSAERGSLGSPQRSTLASLLLAARVLKNDESGGEHASASDLSLQYFCRLLNQNPTCTPSAGKC